jgi:hypothetical protein
MSSFTTEHRAHATLFFPRDVADVSAVIGVVGGKSVDVDGNQERFKMLVTTIEVANTAVNTKSTHPAVMLVRVGDVPLAGEEPTGHSHSVAVADDSITIADACVSVLAAQGGSPTSNDPLGGSTCALTAVSVGDVNRDGVDDVVVALTLLKSGSGPGPIGPIKQGAILVYSGPFIAGSTLIPSVSFLDRDTGPLISSRMLSLVRQLHVVGGNSALTGYFALGSFAEEPLTDDAVGSISPIIYGNMSLGHAATSPAAHELVRFDGSRTNDPFYLALGDTNGDGFQELVMLEPSKPRVTARGPGVMRLYEGRANQLRQDFVEYVNPHKDRILGTSIVLGDLNGDGVDDIVYTSADETTSGVFVSAYLSPLDSVEGVVVTEAEWSWAAPITVALTGIELLVADVTGDGVSDLVVGAANTGAVYVFERREESDPPTEPSFTIIGTSYGDGVSLCTADVNGDGVYDLVFSGAAAGNGSIGVWSSERSGDPSAGGGDTLGTTLATNGTILASTTATSSTVNDASAGIAEIGGGNSGSSGSLDSSALIAIAVGTVLMIAGFAVAAYVSRRRRAHLATASSTGPSKTMVGRPTVSRGQSRSSLRANRRSRAGTKQQYGETSLYSTTPTQYDSTSLYPTPSSLA